MKRLPVLYVARHDALFSAWWAPGPPPPKENRCPKFRAPDIYHDRTVGQLEDILATFVEARILPARETFAVTILAQEWASKGLEAAERVNAARRRKRAIKANPETGMFAPEAVAVTGALRQERR